MLIHFSAAIMSLADLRVFFNLSKEEILNCETLLMRFTKYFSFLLGKLVFLMLEPSKY